MTITVTTEDIKRGKRHDAGQCPIARAVKRSAKCLNILAFRGVIWIGKKAFRPPTEVDEFIYAFDEKRKVEPFTFEL